MKKLILSALLIGSIGSSIAQGNVNISGHLDNTSGTTVNVDISLNDPGTGIINQTATTNSMGDFTTTIVVAGTQGIVEMEFIDCNGATQTASSSFFPGSMDVDFGTLDYCPAVTPTCDASFTVEQEMVGGAPVPNSLIITNTSTGTGLSYSWELGDGNTDTGFSVSHSYAANGPYALCLTVDDGSGCVDTFCDSIGVTAGGLSISKAVVGFTINMPGLLSAEELSASSLNVYPNPATDKIMIELDNFDGDATANIYTVSGVMVHSSKSVNSGIMTLDVSSIPTGTYFLQVVNSDGAITEQIIIK